MFMAVRETRRLFMTLVARVCRGGRARTAPARPAGGGSLRQLGAQAERGRDRSGADDRHLCRHHRLDVQVTTPRVT